MRRDYDTILEGLGNLRTGEYGDVCLEGLHNISGNIRFRKMKIEGSCNSKGKLEGDTLVVGGFLNAAKDIKVKLLNIDGFAKTGKAKVYADRIEVNGVLRNEEEISADIIKVEGIIQTPSLLGDEIELNYKAVQKTSFALDFFGLRQKLFHGADTIECTKLKASYITCKRICAQEIELYDHCVVDEIECDGVIHMDATCRVGIINGDYTLR